MRYLLTIFLLGFQFCCAQVTNVEAQRVKTDTTGWYDEINLGFKLVKEVQKVFSFDTDLRLQYKTRKDLYLALGAYDWSGAGSKSLTHNAFLHLRYNRKLKPDWLVWEAFSQVQFNQITKIKLRSLLGTGPRFKLVGKEKARVYLGTAYMYEYTKEKDLELVVRNEHRLSSYFSFSLFPTDAVSMISTTYYQPKINNWSDYRVSGIFELRTQIARKIFLGLVFKLNYDTFPAVDIPMLTYSIQNKIGVTI